MQRRGEEEKTRQLGTENDISLAVQDDGATVVVSSHVVASGRFD